MVVVLDPDEMAVYEEWRANKLASSVDLSVHAFNVEQEGAALAYEAGVSALYKRSRDSAHSVSENDVDVVIRDNPYRAKGTMGHAAPKQKRVTGK